MSNNAILLTGASGFLGGFLLREWTDHNVVTVGRSADCTVVADLSREVPRLPNNLGNGFTVVHAAGKAHLVPRTTEEEQLFYATNVDGSRNLLTALEHLEYLPEAFVFISTVAVYGKESGELIDESHPLNGATPYARSKIMAEQIIAGWCLEHNVRLVILRLPLIVGKGAPGNLQTMTKWMKRGMYFGIGQGMARKSMVLASDVARQLLGLAAMGGVYNLTDGNHPAMREFEDAMANSLGIGKPLRFPEAALRMAARLGDILGDWFPLNTARYLKLTSSLTFSDEKARLKAGWTSGPVIESLSKLNQH